MSDDAVVAAKVPSGQASLASAKRRFSRNAAFNAATVIAQMAVALVVTPIIVHGLGEVEYGIWMLVAQTVAGMSLADFGMSVTVVRYLAHHHARDDHDAMERLYSTALVFSLLPAIVVILGGIGLAIWGPVWFHFPRNLDAPVHLVTVMVTLSLASVFPGAVLGAALPACSRYDWLAVRNVVWIVARGLLYWAVLEAGWGLIGVGTVTMVTQLAAIGVCIWLGRRLMPWLKFRRRALSRATMRTLVGFSFYAFLISVSVTLMYSVDNIVVGWGLGPTAVAFYAVAGGLADRLQGSLKIVTTLFAPLAAQMHALDRRREMQQLFLTGTRLTLLLVAAPVLGLCLLGPDFLQLWVGPVYRQNSSGVLAVLSLSVLAYAMAMPCTQVLYGMGKHQFNAWLSCIEAIAGVTLSVTLVLHLGAIGVAWGTLIPALIVEAVVMPVYTMRQIEVAMPQYYVAVLLRPLAAVAPTGLWFAAVHYNGWARGWISFAGAVALGVALFLLCLRSYGMQAAERRHLRQSLTFLPVRWLNRLVGTGEDEAAASSPGGA